MFSFVILTFNLRYHSTIHRFYLVFRIMAETEHLKDIVPTLVMAIVIL